MQAVYRYSMGADPEFFVAKALSETIIPVCGLVGGTKEEPKAYSERDYPGHKYQEDGAVFEYNIPACFDSAPFQTAIRTANSLARTLLQKKNLEMRVKVENRFSVKELEPFEQVRKIGCDPDISAYDADGNLNPVARVPFKVEDFGTTRYAGGHIHFGFDKELIPDHVFVALLDSLLYLPMLPFDQQGGRRRFYGQAGLYRSKDYGIEYRTPSNFWIADQGRYGWVASKGFGILHALHTDAEDLAELFRLLPIDRARTLINSGINTAAEKQAWRTLVREIQALHPIAMTSTDWDDGR